MACDCSRLARIIEELCEVLCWDLTARITKLGEAKTHRDVEEVLEVEQRWRNGIS